MIFLIKLAARWGWPGWAAKAFGAIVPIALAALAIWAAIALIRGDAERDGAVKVSAKAATEHTARVAEARGDERAAAGVATRIAERTARSDALTDAYVRSTIEDLRNALQTQSAPDGAGAAPAAAPVDRLSASINAGIARANRAADAAEAAR